jgi:hypothetical protein
LALLSRRTTASSPATIHSARFSVRFMRISLQGYRGFLAVGHPG